VSAGASYDGLYGCEIARRLGVPEVVVFDVVGSTMDVAHALAAQGCAAGTVVLAEEQVAGRGRAGRQWVSLRGAGIWLTIVERPRSPSGVDVLSLRAGLAVALSLEEVTGTLVQLKWPNDIYSGGRKLGGILIESRWRAERLDWVAIGVGLNLRVPSELPNAAGLGDRYSRMAILSALVPRLRQAAERVGHLDEEECRLFAARDLAAGRNCIAPVRGRVAGIANDGALLVVTAGGVVACREGSLILEEESQ
jgi:BirA family biotin operon repressor/biotin-[acetyl-CoA-carboxylase] ligase